MVPAGHPKNVTNVAFVGDGLLVSGGLGDVALGWTLDTPDPVAPLDGHGQAVAGIAGCSNDEVWTIAYGGTARRWSTDNWSAVTSFDLPGDRTPSGIATHPVTGHVAVTGDGGVFVSDEAGAQLAEHSISIEGVSSPCWSQTGEWLAVGGADGRVRLYHSS